MIKTIKSIFPMLLLAAGVCVWSGCSQDDDRIDDVDEVMPPNPLTEAAGTLNERMAGLDFQELAPLAEVVPVTTRAESNTTRSEFESKLSSLLSLLEANHATTRSAARGQRFSFQAFNGALQLAWDLSVMLGDEGESSSSWFGLNSTKQGEVNYTAKNGNLYTVKGIIDKEVAIQFRGFKTKVVVKKAGELFVYKDGEQVLKILTGSENNRPVWLPILIKDNFFTGQMFYRDYEISLTYDKNSTHSRTIDLTYSKTDMDTPLLSVSAKLEDDADILKIIKHDVNVQADFTVTALNNLLTFVGTTNNVNYLVVNGVKIAKCLEEGTTEEDCKNLVESFNNNLTMSFLLSNEPVGDLYMGIRHDADTNRYFPVVMMHSSLLGDKDYPVSSLLEMMGVDFADILRSIADSI